jgi:hypothetical protein
LDERGKEGVGGGCGMGYMGVGYMGWGIGDGVYKMGGGGWDG